jgi:hypothetical protein
MMRKVNAWFVCVLMFIAVSCYSQPVFKVGIHQNGDYELIEQQNGAGGASGIDITDLLLRATNNRSAIRAAQILRTSEDLRNAGYTIQ